MIFKKYPQLYAIVIPAISVPIMLGITFAVMKIEVVIKWVFNHAQNARLLKDGSGLGVKMMDSQKDSLHVMGVVQSFDM